MTSQEEKYWLNRLKAIKRTFQVMMSIPFSNKQILDKRDRYLVYHSNPLFDYLKKPKN